MEAELKRILFPVMAALTSVLALALARKIAFRLMQRWASGTDTRMDDILLNALRLPSVYWIIAIGLSVGVQASDLPDRQVFYIGKTIQVLIILSVTVAAAKLAGEIFHSYVQKAGLPIPATGLANGIIKGSFLLVGSLIILSVIGISVTPILTALGVGGLAVALALQDTLSNLFAGIHILMEKPIRVGDFIRLETGQEGYVEDITWRTTRVRVLPNNMVIIPNSRIAQSTLTNYHLPEKRMSLLISVSVSYSSQPEKVEAILMEESTKSVGEVPGLLGDPAPFVRFIPGFGESSLDFTLICQVGEFVDQYLVQHELRKRILRRFRAEGIEIPFPHRTVYMMGGSGDADKPASSS
jgi:small-conductance mechanosensitive channel